jgi:predicted molibdopterin-dependent oxidoreductase YjgC
VGIQVSGAILRNHPFLRKHKVESLNKVDAEQAAQDRRSGARVLAARVGRAARVTDQCIPGVVFIPTYFAEATANLLTIDALDATAKIPEFKACAVCITPAREEELVNAEARTQRGRR